MLINQQLLEDMPKIAYGPGIISAPGSDLFSQIKFDLVDLLKTGGKNRKKLKAINGIILSSIRSGQKMLIDTSEAYGDAEPYLGTLIKKYGKDHFFIVTKLSNTEQRSESAVNALNKSLQKLNLNQVDAFLMHWPQTNTFLRAWKEMEECFNKKLARYIGVCNFNIHHFKELEASGATIMPMIEQVECHPLFNNKEVIDYARSKGMVIMAYSPTGRMDKRIIESPVLKDIASAHQKTVVQIILRWQIEEGRIPIINTYDQRHFRENNDIFDFVLTQNDIEKIDGINANIRLRYDPDHCDFNKL